MNDDTQLDLKSPTKLTEWNNEPSVRELKQDYEDAKVETDVQVTRINTWLDNLNITGSAALPKSKSRSTIQPKLIRKQAEWRYSSLSEPFLSTPDVFNVYPVTHGDKEAAYQNELVLNYQFNNLLNKVSFIDEYVREVVDTGTVIVRTGWEYEEEEIEVEKPIFSEKPNLSPQFIEQLQQLTQLYQADPQAFGELPEEQQRSVVRSMEMGQPIQVFQSGTETVKETVVVKNQPTAHVCDYNAVVTDPSCEGDLDKAKFVIYRFNTSLEELRKAGIYQNLEYINVEGNNPLTHPDEEQPDNNNFNFNDAPRKKFTAYEYWGYWDIDGSGLVKPIVATWVGDVLIRMEENPFPDKKVPFVNAVYLPVRKSLYGQPDGELIKENQDVVGAVTRGMIDILASNANGQRGTAKGALDATNKRRFDKGLDYEFNANMDPTRAFYTHAFAEIPASAQFMYQAQTMEAESMSGVKAFAGAGGITGQALGDSATGIRSVLDATSKRELGILRRLAEGIIKIGRKFISMNSEFLSDEEIIRVTNDRFVAISRDNLAGKFDLRLSISTAEEDNAKAQELAFMLQTMGNTMDVEMSKIILCDIARLRKMPELAEKLKNYQPQPDPLAVKKAELEIQLLEAQVQETLAEAQQRAATAMKNQAEAGKTQSETDLNNLDFVEQESGVKQERELQKQGEQAKANAKLEVVKSLLNQNKETSPVS